MVHLSGHTLNQMFIVVPNMLKPRNPLRSIKLFEKCDVVKPIRMGVLKPHLYMSTMHKYMSK